jgi:hypothetical protein
MSVPSSLGFARDSPSWPSALSFPALAFFFVFWSPPAGNHPPNTGQFPFPLVLPWFCWASSPIFWLPGATSVMYAHSIKACQPADTPPLSRFALILAVLGLVMAFYLGTTTKSPAALPTTLKKQHIPGDTGHSRSRQPETHPLPTLCSNSFREANPRPLLLLPRLRPEIRTLLPPDFASSATNRNV